MCKQVFRSTDGRMQPVYLIEIYVHCLFSYLRRIHIVVFPCTYVYCFALNASDLLDPAADLGMTDVGVGAGGISTSALDTSRDGTGELAVNNEGTAAVAVAGALAAARVDGADEAVSGAATAVGSVHLVALLLGDKRVRDRLESLGVVKVGGGSTPAREEAVVASGGTGINQRDGLDGVTKGNGLSGLDESNVVVDAIVVEPELGVGLDVGDLVDLALADLVAANADGELGGLLSPDTVTSSHNVARVDNGATAVELTIDVVLNLVRNLLDVGVLSANDISVAGDSGSKSLSSKAENNSRLHCDVLLCRRGEEWRRRCVNDLDVPTITGDISVD